MILEPRLTGARWSVHFGEDKIDKIFAELNQCRLPGAAVGIAIDGRPVYRKGFGLANMELPVTLSPTIRMRVNSVTKQFTCLAYLLLCEQGKARIDDELGKHLPEINHASHGATIRHLMGHVSGLRDAKDIFNQFGGTKHPVSSADVVSLYRSIDDTNFKPGTSWAYNNGAYLLLTVIVERLAGKSFEEVLREQIFEPIGMYDTRVRRWDSDFVPNSATLHTAKQYRWLDTEDCGGGPSVAYEKTYLNTETAGEGGLVTTVDDLLRWLAHMDHPTVGNAATWKTMRTPYQLENGTSTGYGSGLLTGRYRGVETLSHGGTGMGSNSQMLKVPAAGLDVVIILNRDDINAVLLTNKVLDACLPELEPARSAKAQPCITGVFRSEATHRVIELSAKGRQQFVAINGAEIPFDFDDEGELHPSSLVSIFKYAVSLIGDRGRPTAIRFSDFGSFDELTLIERPTRAPLERIAGHYESRSTGTRAAIWETEGTARLSTNGQRGSAEFTLECLTDDAWRARSTGSWPWGGLLQFSRDGSHFFFGTSTLRNKALLFERCSGASGSV